MQHKMAILLTQTQKLDMKKIKFGVGEETMVFDF